MAQGQGLPVEELLRLAKLSLRAVVGCELGIRQPQTVGRGLHSKLGSSVQSDQEDGDRGRQYQNKEKHEP